MDVPVEPAKKLDDRGRCCGRKPLVYKRDGIKFCRRCDAEFDIVTGAQTGNWAYRPAHDGFFPTSLRRPT